MSKVLVIGLDGATFDLIDPWVEQGNLPTIAKCLSKGTRGRLLSTPLSNSAQAWSSFATGKNPGKHGIYDFFETRSDSYGVRFLNASFRKGRSLWRIASDAGKKVGVMNVPITYPPEQIDGFFIPGLDSPGIDADFAYPSGLMDEIKRNVGDYILEAGIWGHIRKGRPDKALQGLLDMAESRTATAKYLMENKEWDLFTVVYTATDKVQHHFWKYIDPKRPESRSKEGYADAIFKVYEAIDNGIGELLKTIGDDCSVIIMSDHGAGPSSRRTMYINRWLNSEGFLRFEDDGKLSGGWRRLKREILETLNNEVKKRLPRRVKELMLKHFPGLRDKVDSVLFLPGIDWSRSVAYSRENHPAIFINTFGREAGGIVKHGDEYEKVRDQIIDRLRSLKCPETGRPIVKEIVRRAEIYQGPDAFKAPDIVFKWNDHVYVHRPSGNGRNKDFLETLDDKTLLASENTTRPSGIHRDHGIFIALGDRFKPGEGIEGACIYDLAPTVLYLLGLSVTEDMDGNVLETAINKEFLENNPVRKGTTVSEQDSVPQGFDLDETKAIQERLQGLGYID